MNNLPKITYINFEGFDSPLNHLILREFSKNVQIISIFDDELCGENKCEMTMMENILNFDNKFQQIHQILIPLNCKRLLSTLMKLRLF